MAIKGSATIELTNADGSKEIIKHDNMITSAVNDICMSQRGEMASILKIVNNGDSYAQTLFGGILLFDETLNDNPDDYFLPSVKVTGYASQDAYAGLDIARGSFNASEGGVQADGSYKFVWDFATSQGNGTIKSLALCPNIMGQIGLSDTVVLSERQNFYVKNDVSAPFDTYGRMLPENGTTDGMPSFYFCIVAVIDDIAYAMEGSNINIESKYSSRHILNNGGILKLYKFKLGASSISLGDKAGRARYLGCVDVPLPSDFVSTLYTNCSIDSFFDYDTGTLVIFPCQKKANIEKNGTMKYIEINLKDNMAISTYTFTNNTAGTIIEKHGSSLVTGDGEEISLFVCKDYIVNLSLVGSEYKMYATKRSDNTQVVEVKYSSGNSFIAEGSHMYFRPLFVNNNILVFRYSYSPAHSDYRYYVLDMETGVIKDTNILNLSINNMLAIGKKVVYARCFSYLQYRLMINPFVLTTKNNLNTPVTKTASQTMKITYTLSEVAESGV